MCHWVLHCRWFDQFETGRYLFFQYRVAGQNPDFFSPSKKRYISGTIHPRNKSLACFKFKISIPNKRFGMFQMTWWKWLNENPYWIDQGHPQRRFSFTEINKKIDANGNLLILACYIALVYTHHHVILIQGRIFSADPTGFVLPYPQHFLGLPPAASIRLPSETHSRGKFFRLILMWETFYYDVGDRFDSTVNSHIMNSEATSRPVASIAHLPAAQGLDLS